MPILSKILEKIVAQQLSAFLESKRTLSRTQHGFRPQLSAETALITLTNKLYSNMDNKKLSLVTLQDLSKAFDSVHHVALLEKLIKFQVDTFWFSHYLKDRSQMVKISNTTSKTATVNYVVPQGSILGPVLFNIYVNDLREAITDCEVIQYADDTQLVHTGSIDALPDLITRAETTLSLAKNYFSSNGLMLNADKAQCIFIGTRPLIRRLPPETKINFDNTSITPSTQVKNLGVMMDCHLNFDVHIHEMYRKAMGHLLFLNRIKDKFESDTRKTVVEFIVLSAVYYCLPVYGTTNATLLYRVQQLQNFAAKMCWWSKAI